MEEVIDVFSAIKLFNNCKWYEFKKKKQAKISLMHCLFLQNSEIISNLKNILIETIKYNKAYHVK